ncbi:MAG: hypothetical protein WBA93_30670 [Microcoleaceae cyanobacterium]
MANKKNDLGKNFNQAMIMLEKAVMGFRNYRDWLSQLLSLRQIIIQETRNK